MTHRASILAEGEASGSCEWFSKGLSLARCQQGHVDDVRLIEIDTDVWFERCLMVNVKRTQGNSCSQQGLPPGALYRPPSRQIPRCIMSLWHTGQRPEDQEAPRSVGSALQLTPTKSYHSSLRSAQCQFDTSVHCSLDRVKRHFMVYSSSYLGTR